MTTPEHLHLALNHFPILGVPIAGAVIARGGVLAENEESLRVGFFLLMVCAAVTPFVMSTGSAASDAYDGASFVDSDGYGWMTTHGGRAETTAIAAYVAGGLGALGLLGGFFFKKFLRITGILALSAAFITGALAVWTADSGGKIRRPDFREKTETTPISEKTNLMKTIITLLAFATLSAGALQAKDAKPETKPAAKPEAAGEKASGDLHALMKSIGGDFGKLMKSIGEPAQVDADKELAKKLAETAEKCSDLALSKAEKASSEAEGARITKAYKAEIAKLAENFRKIETALGKKDFAGAKKAAEACTSLKKQDHPEFIQSK